MWAAGIGAGATLGLLHVVARLRGARLVAGVLKPMPILLLALLVVAEAAPVAGRYRWLVVAALALSMAGDVWLLFPERFFVPGLASFLAAHLVYIAAFRAGAGGGAPVALVPFALFGAGMLAYLWPHLGRDRAPVLVYVAVIVVMGW